MLSVRTLCCCFILAQTFLPLCTPQLLAAEEENDRVLHILTWEDYFDSNVVNQFQKDYNCIVSIDSYESNDSIFSALYEHGSGYDVVTPSAPVAAALYRAGLIRELDHSKIPNLTHLDRSKSALYTDPAMVYSVPYTQTVTGIGYNKSKVPESALTGWDIFDNPMLLQKGALLDDSREVLGAALKHLGYSLNTTNQHEIDQAEEVALQWRKNHIILDLDIGKKGLADGEYLIAQAYDGDVAAIMDTNPEISFFVPPEGAALNSDDFVITTNTPLPDLAHAFINHMLKPEMAKINMENILYYMPNATAFKLLGDDNILKRSKVFDVPEETTKKCEVVVDLLADNEKYSDAWQQVLGK